MWQIGQGSLSDASSKMANLTDGEDDEQSKDITKIFNAFRILLGNNVTDEQIESDIGDIVTFELNLSQV